MRASRVPERWRGPSWSALALPLLLLLAAGSLEGCGLFTTSLDQTVQEVKTKPSPGRPELTVGELDQMARNYSDRLVARVSTACDHIKREAKEDASRTTAHQLKLSVALAAYDIMTSSGGSPQVPGAAQHAIDLAILTELEGIRWVDEKEARQHFGQLGEPLVEALTKAQEEVWQILARVMKPQQVDQLRTMIRTWRQQNPTVEWLARVRFDVIAQGVEGTTFAKSVGEGFNPLQPVVRAVDETRLLIQQALFFMKRMPTILDWTAEATLTDALAVPKLDALVHSLQETLGAVARASATLERLTAPSSQEPAINSTLQDVKDSLVEARDLVQEVRGLESAVAPLLDRSLAPAPGERSVDPGTVASKVSDAARDATSLVRETRGLVESRAAMEHIDEVLDRASRKLSQTGAQLINRATWRAVGIVFLVAILVALYRGASFGIQRRQARASNRPVP
ncbi:MAG TPA: hypothetical protein VKW04_22895 [Planctomycetota bacterium]|nr:hypothetical protein [Planctomycetota bacterium]